MGSRLYDSHPVFSVPDIRRTAAWYETHLGFRAVAYLDAAEPHICLYRDRVEIILTESGGRPVLPNRRLYGYGYDAYLITDAQEGLQRAFTDAGVRVVRPLSQTDYHNREFAVEDCDGRWLGFGIKE